MDIAYREFKPSPELAPYVECYWLQTHDGTPGEESPVQCCLPLGMLEVLIHPDETLSDILHEGRWQQLPRAFFHGIYNSVARSIHPCGFLFSKRKVNSENDQLIMAFLPIIAPIVSD